MMRNTLPLLTALTLSLATPAFADGTYKIGNIVAASGPLKGFGESAQAAVDIAVERINAAGGINGKPIELVRFDTGSDPKQASVATRKLAQDDGVLAIIGPLSSGESSVAINDAERLKILMLPTSASAAGLTDGRTYAYRVSADEGTQFGRLLASIKKKGIKADTAEIVYISDEVVSNNAGTKLYPGLLTTAGIKHGDPIAIQSKSFDMSAQVAKIVQANPDIIALAALSDSASKVIKELHRQGYKGRVIGSQLFADPNIGELLGPEGDGTLFVSGFSKESSPAGMSFDNRFLEVAKERGIHRLGAHHADAQAYDIVYLVKQLIEKSGVTGDPAKLTEERAALVKAVDGIKFGTVLGQNLCFKAHDAMLPGYVIELKNAAWKEFDAAPADPC